jgi:putative membrane protein
VAFFTAASQVCMLSHMVKLVARWFLLAAALLLTAQFYPGIQVHGYGAALVAALVLGLLNTLLRPVLVVLTLPVTVVTLGLFLFVVNAMVFYSAAWLLPGLNVAGFGAALVASLLYSVCGMVIDTVLERLLDEG